VLRSSGVLGLNTPDSGSGVILRAGVFDVFQKYFVVVTLLVFGCVNAQQSYPGYIGAFKAAITRAVFDGNFYTDDKKLIWACWERPEVIVDYKTESNWQVSGGCDVKTADPKTSVERLRNRLLAAMGTLFGSTPTAVKLSKPQLYSAEKCFLSSLSVAGTFKLGAVMELNFGLYRPAGGPFPTQGTYYMNVSISQGRPKQAKVQSYC
jgi:hypothetical protein